MPRATVAIEDRRFYDHSGLDPEGIARAVVRDVQAGEVVEGGSTITQQLVRNLYISQERTVERKLKEACLAVKLDRAWSKEQVLESYLNSVYYGHLAYGIEAAAQTYFAKSAKNLTLGESALLAGLTQAPSAYDPFVEPAKAIARRNQVLDAMLRQGVITQAEHDRAASGRTLRLKPGNLYREIREPYFFGYVRDELIRRYGAETVRSGGLRVYTTIVPRWQRLAQQAISSTLTEPDDPAAALISIDPSSGAIRAMAAVIPGRANNQFNLLSQARRQPGSTFKTFVLDGRGRAEDRSGCDVLRLGAVHVPADGGRQLRGRVVVVREDLRLDVRRLDVHQSRDAAIRQLDLRPADAGRHPRAGGRGRASPWCPDAARRQRHVCPGDGSRLDRGVPARHGLGVRDAGRRRGVLRADGDPQGRASRGEGRHQGQVGRAEAEAGHPGRGRGGGDGDPRGQRPLRDGDARGIRPAGGREDRDDRRARRCLVRRLHAAARNGRLDGIHPR